jgi:hypothetical protein
VGAPSRAHPSGHRRRQVAVGTSQGRRSPQVVASISCASLPVITGARSSWSPPRRSSQAPSRRGLLSPPFRSSQTPGRRGHLSPPCRCQVVVGSTRLPSGHHRRLVVVSISPSSGHCRRLGISALFFPFPVLSSFPCNTFVPNTRHLPCRQVKLVRTRYICLAPIVKHHKDEHNMENGKNAKANMWSRRYHEASTGSRSYHEDPGP